MTWKPSPKPKRFVPHKEATMTAIQKRILSIMLVLATISTFIGYGSCIVCDDLNARDGINIEAILERK